MRNPLRKMVRMLFGSTRRRMMTMVVIAVLPGFMVATLNAMHAVSNAKAATRASLVEALDRLVFEQHFAAGEITDDMNRLALALGDPHASCSASLNAFFQANVDYRGMGVVSPEGRIVCRLDRDGTREVVPDSGLLEKAESARGSTLTTLRKTSGGRLPVVMFVHAFTTTEGHRFVLFAMKSFDSVFHLRNIKFTPVASITIVDASGDFYRFHADKEGADIGRDIARKNLYRMLDPVGRPFLYESGSGLLGMVPLGMVGVPDGIVISIPRHELYRNAYAQIHQTAWLLSLFLVLTLMLAWWISKRFIIKPQLTLMSVAENIARGNYFVRTGIKYGSDDVSRLALSFDGMADEIEKNAKKESAYRRKLERTNRIYEVQQSVIDALLNRENQEGLMDTVCKASCEIGGLALAWIGEVDTEARVLRPVCWAGTCSEAVAGIVADLENEVPTYLVPCAETARTGVLSIMDPYPCVANGKDEVAGIGNGKVGAILAVQVGT